MALNLGPVVFTFSQAISFFVNCEGQAEAAELWEKLSAGEEKQRCGWLKDQYGISWQTIPTVLDKILNGQDPKKSREALNTMLQIDKIGSEILKPAYSEG